MQWGEIEPHDGVFDFSILDSRMANATAQGLGVALMVWVSSPGGVAAPWLIEDKLVPAVRVAGSGSHPTVDFAWYFSPVYQQRHARMINALATHLRQLPDEQRRMIRGFQPAVGSTGDFTPWHGTPLDKQYDISKPQWLEYADNQTSMFVDAFAGSEIPLTWNFGDSIGPSNCSGCDQPESRSRLEYLFSRLPANNTNVKLGMVSDPNSDRSGGPCCEIDRKSDRFLGNALSLRARVQVSHSYQLNGEADYVSSWKPYIAAGVDRRSHGEVGDGSGRELEQPFWCEHEPESTHSCC